MAEVHVTTTNKSGQKAVLRLDDERDAERIEYLQKRVRREALESAKVSKPASKSTAS